LKHFTNCFCLFTSQPPLVFHVGYSEHAIQDEQIQQIFDFRVHLQNCSTNNIVPLSLQYRRNAHPVLSFERIERPVDLSYLSGYCRSNQGKTSASAPDQTNKAIVGGRDEGARHLSSRSCLAADRRGKALFIRCYMLSVRCFRASIFKARRFGFELELSGVILRDGFASIRFGKEPSPSTSLSTTEPNWGSSG